MLTKRAAILAVYAGALAKMAHADQPPPDAETSKPIIPTVPTGVGSQMPTGVGSQMRTTMTPAMIADMEAFNRPTSWTVNLDKMKSLDVYLGGKKVTISAADLFAAISG